MERLEAEQTVESIYKCCLRRSPKAHERSHWANAVLGGMKIHKFIELLIDSEEYKKANKVVPYFDPGHYYSPIVNPDDAVKEYMSLQKGRVGACPAGINMNIERMRNFFVQNAKFMSSASFERTPTIGIGTILKTVATRLATL